MAAANEPTFDGWMGKHFEFTGRRMLWFKSYGKIPEKKRLRWDPDVPETSLSTKMN